MTSEVRILNVSLEEDDLTDHVIMRGVLDQNTLKYIRMDWYQRERGFSDRHTNEIIAAYFAGSKLADITVGMRGDHVTSKANIWSLHDKCFCIDGGQRLYAAGMAVKERPDLKISLGAKVYTKTTEEFENELFCKLGTTQVKIGPSILLRNRKKKSQAANLLVTVSKHPDFALKDRIAWDQRKTVHELMSGYQLARIVGALHSHKVGGLKSHKPYDWTLRQLSGARDEPRPHLKPVFLLTIARLFSSYTDFWDGTDRNDFYFLDKFVKRLKKFPLSDYVTPSKGVQTDVLYEILRKRLGLDPVFEQPMADAAE